MADIAKLKAANLARWQDCKIHPEQAVSFNKVAARLIAAKPRYQAVQQATGVPWFVIAVIHEREASQRWDTQLGQGDPLGEVSRHVPAGRGPFKTWEAGAFDALANCAPHAALNKDWSVGGALVLLEQYNGLGYAARGLPSPYVWSGTDQYAKGKFRHDGPDGFDPEFVDKQIGCAGLLIAMIQIDGSIGFGQPASAPPPVSPSKPAPIPPTPPAPPQGNWLANLIVAFLSMFKGKGK